MKLFRMLISRKSRPRWNLGQVGSKTRPLDQSLEEPCTLTRGHRFDRIFMELYENVSIKSKPGLNVNHVGSKSRLLGQA